VSFGAPQFLAFLAVVPLAGLALAALWRWRDRAEAAYVGRGALAALSVGRSPARRALKTGLLLAALALLAVAAARPQVGSREAPLERRGVDLVIVLDVSESMEADDVAPSRRERAQQEIGALLDRLRGDRVGLVLVAGSAFLRSPVSSDLGVIKQMVASAPRERLLLQAGTALAGGIDIAVEALSGSEAATRLILVVSDGEDHQGRALEAARSASRKGLLVYAAGVGSERGGTISQVDPMTGATRPKVDPATGAPLITRLDEALLRRLAAAGGGRYVALEGSGSPLAGLAGDLARLQATVFATGSERRPEERFQWFVAGAAFLLALELAVSDAKGRPRWSFDPSAMLRAGKLRTWPWRKAVALAPLALIAALLATACATTAHSLNEDGNRFFARGEYDRALESYRRARVERPDFLQLDYNIGNALHRLGEYSRAIEETQRATAATETGPAFLAHYSLGNHYFRLGQLQAAFDSYKQALLLNPDDLDTKYNLEAVARLLAEPATGGPPPPPAAGSPQEAPPGQEMPAPGEADGGEGAPQEGQPPPSSGERSPAARLEQALAEALAGIEEEFTIEEALRVLDILREQQRLKPEPAGQPGSGEGLDY
jgi:Ca-activated chloride channel family protein